MERFVQKELTCPACGEKVVPVKQTICVRKGRIMDFVQEVEVCPNPKCREIINR